MFKFQAANNSKCKSSFAETTLNPQLGLPWRCLGSCLSPLFFLCMENTQARKMLPMSAGFDSPQGGGDETTVVITYTGLWLHSLWHVIRGNGSYLAPSQRGIKSGSKTCFRHWCFWKSMLCFKAYQSMFLPKVVFINKVCPIWGGWWRL